MDKKVFSFWYSKLGSKGFSKLELLCIKSWLDKGYIFELYTYNLDDILFKKLDTLFENFKLKDANEIIPFDELFYDDRGAGLAAFSDYFRFVKIARGGGIWVDMDMLCLAGFKQIKQDYIFITELIDDKSNFEQVITTSVLSFPNDSKFANTLIDKAKFIINSKRDPKTKLFPWGIIGPRFLAACVKEFDFEKFAFDYKKACQIPYFEAEKFIFNETLDETQLCLHFYTEMWRGKKLKKNATYYKDCIYERLQQKHDINELLRKLDYKIPLFDKYIYGHICYIKWKIKNSFLIKISHKSKIREYLRHPKKLFCNQFKKH